MAVNLSGVSMGSTASRSYAGLPSGPRTGGRISALRPSTRPCCRSRPAAVPRAPFRAAPQPRPTPIARGAAVPRRAAPCAGSGGCPAHAPGPAAQHRHFRGGAPSAAPSRRCCTLQPSSAGSRPDAGTHDLGSFEYLFHTTSPSYERRSVPDVAGDSTSPLQATIFAITRAPMTDMRRATPARHGVNTDPRCLTYRSAVTCRGCNNFS